MLYETGSVAQAGAIAALENVGRLTTLLIGGVLADRFSRKVLLVAAPIIQAIAVGAVVPLVTTHHVSVYSLGLVAVIQGLVNGLSGGANDARAQTDRAGGAVPGGLGIPAGP